MSRDSLTNKSRALCEEHHCTLLYLVVSGSHAYGTATKDSDLDIRGVFLPPWEAYVGLSNIEMIERRQDEIVLNSVQKYVRLTLNGNPNLMDWLFVPEDCILYIDQTFKKAIWDHRDLFLSRALYPRFRGYAYSHLQKMQRGVTRDLGAMRKESIEKFGYSTKNAMHLIRLARQGCEVLETGSYNVRRFDAKELLVIRSGRLTKEEVLRTGEVLLARMEKADAVSKLPSKPGRKEIEKELVNLTLELLGGLGDGKTN